MIGQRQLNQQPVGFVLSVELADLFEQRALADVGGQLVQAAADTDLFSGFLLIACVDHTRWIFAHEHDVQSRLSTVLFGKGCRFGFYLSAKCFRDRFSIKNLSRHSERRYSMQPWLHCIRICTN